MTLPKIEQYADDRKQAYVKHYFLRLYFEALVFKVASVYDTIVYVDGYSGPWQSGGDKFADTSFGIALDVLRSAKETWREKGRTVRVRAVLVEENKAAFGELLKLQGQHPDVEIYAINRDFRRSVGEILAEIPPNAFSFVLIDPLGWRIPIDAVAPLLARPNTEVLFNFMFDFINRAASMAHSIAGLDELLPVPGWREALARIDIEVPAEGRAAARKRILIDAFREVLRMKGGYLYVAEMPVLRPIKDRTLYSLVYGSRSAHGIKVFRSCQKKALTRQEEVRSATKVAAATAASGQIDMFGTTRGLSPDPIAAFLEHEARRAEADLIDAARQVAGVRYGSVWPHILSRYAICLSELNSIAARLQKQGTLKFLNWSEGQRVPKQDSLMSATAGSL